MQTEHMTEKKKVPMVIHHRGCMDGWMGGLLFWLAHRSHAEFHSAQYGDPAPPDEEVQGRVVRIVDFSYPREELERIHEAAEDLLVLDHHQTAQANCAGLDYCHFDMERSGAGLAWDLLEDEVRRSIMDAVGDDGEPVAGEVIELRRRMSCLRSLVAYVEDRDLWRWQLPDSRKVSAALASYPRGSLGDPDHVAAWIGEVLWADLSDHIADGRAILRQQEQQLKIMKAKAWPAELDGLRAMVAVAPLLQSELGHELLHDHTLAKETIEVAVLWWQKPAGGFVYSLRSAEDGPDVSRIARVRGGGGHTHAAGFTSDRPPWDLVVRL